LISDPPEQSAPCVGIALKIRELAFHCFWRILRRIPPSFLSERNSLGLLFCAAYSPSSPVEYPLAGSNAWAPHPLFMQGQLTSCLCLGFPFLLFSPAGAFSFLEPAPFAYHIPQPAISFLLSPHPFCVFRQRIAGSIYAPCCEYGFPTLLLRKDSD